MSSSAPLVIWTLQRTGGTNLALQLQARSGLAMTEHEPFNVERQHGLLTRLWRSEQDPAALQQRMAQVCGEPQIIKHCVELVPWEVSQALLEASSRAGWKHLFLYRQQALGRLLSLHYARRSGVWGPGMAPSDQADADSALPVAELLQHERLCAGRLQRAWESLLSLDQTPWALAYETTYDPAQATTAAARLAQLATWLHMPGEPASLHAWADNVLRQGDQGTRQHYAQVPNLQELALALRTHDPFVPAPWLRRDGQWPGDGETVPVVNRLLAPADVQAAMQALLTAPDLDALRLLALQRAMRLCAPQTRPPELEQLAVLLDCRYRRDCTGIFKRLRALRRQLAATPDQLADFESLLASALGEVTVGPAGYAWPAAPG